LRRDLDRLTAKLGVLTATQDEHGAALRDLADLRDRISRILAILNENETAQPSHWFWLTMTEEQRQEKLSELSDWVETVLRIQYPSYTEAYVKACWPSHPEAQWELAWLYQLWALIYLTNRLPPTSAADWHDRWL